MKMRKLLLAQYGGVFPDLVSNAAIDLARTGDQVGESARVLEYILRRDLDTLIPELLRAEAFVSLNLSTFPLLETTDQKQIQTELTRITRVESGAIGYGDGRYLKIANSVRGDEYGDAMLRLIAGEIVAADFDVYARFRQGDEFIIMHSSTKEMLDRIEEMLDRLAAHEVVSGLPVGVDFGYASHAEVAQTYQRLLAEGWTPPQNKQGNQIFFDVALKIAKLREEVQKIYNRAWLLFSLYEELADTEPDQYRLFETELTRGSRFITPDSSWLTVPEEQLPDFIRLKTLAFLQPQSKDLFTSVCTEVAESVYFGQIVG